MSAPVEVGLTPEEKTAINAERNANQATNTAAAIAAASSASPSSAPSSPATTSDDEIPIPDAVTPAEVSSVLENLMNPIFKRSNVAPLDAEELERGGRALAPALNRYIPWLFKNHKELVVAGMFVGGVTVVRVADAIERRRAREEREAEEKKRAAAAAAAPVKAAA